ncbi:FecR domain-containing protein [Sphingomonas sp. AR_OL41]|uniref:FecR family protein n=1 Tax=Sphingomonas sp. AR_OL41 TaxID=3042729 RepID=UPI0024819118|nr:FecR domain-containing protein [Sphingomonas sp. AR_OL41]MDH7975225.1 FecR domain-containing protein [Sphingomonas sp. AR_OL41]
MIRIAEPAFNEWEAFDAWLAADPGHGDAYWPMAEADRAIAAVVAIPTAPTPAASVSDIAPYSARWRVITGWAIAASLVAMVGGYSLWPRGGGQIVIESPAGVSRTLDLPDGSQVALNGGTRIIVDRVDSRNVRLDRGEASFAVRHDPDHPFALRVGDALIADVGTRFDVVRGGGQTRIAVAEGAVRYIRGDRSQLVAAGETLEADDANATIALGTVDPGTVAGWRNHRLAYDRAPLAIVAADLSRSTGYTVSVAPDLARRSFTGTISTDGPRAEVIPRFAEEMDVKAVHVGDGWILTRR